MKQLLMGILVAGSMVCGTAGHASAFDLKSVLGGIAGNSSTETGNSGSSSDSKLGSLVSGLVSNLISTDKIEPSSMVGTWKYTSPAVCFQSDNLLQKAGGAAAAASVEEKLAGYYAKAGLTGLVLTVNDDLTFSMKASKITLSGTISKEESTGDIYFQFKAFNKVNIGKMKAYITMTGQNSMSIMFDVSKLISIIKAAGSITGNSTINSVSTLLESYDGICAGFKLAKQ